MDTASTVALSRLVAQARAMDVTANNLANATTPGFKTGRMLFSDWLSPKGETRADGRQVPGGRVVTYTQDRASYSDQREGSLSKTGNPLDLALGGAGFFTVQTPQGARLTRAGRFGVGAGGAVVDAAGDGLLDTAGQPIRLSPADTNLTVAGDGTISSENGRVARVGVVAPADPRRMKAEGGDRADASGTTTTPMAAPAVIQGSVEDSNVSPIVETTRMMTDLREFQFVSQFVEAEADREKSAIDKILQPAG